MNGEELLGFFKNGLGIFANEYLMHARHPGGQL